MTWMRCQQDECGAKGECATIPASGGAQSMTPGSTGAIAKGTAWGIMLEQRVARRVQRHGNLHDWDVGSAECYAEAVHQCLGTIVLIDADGREVER